MDTKRLILYGALFFICFSLYQAWQKDMRKTAAATTKPSSTLATQVPTTGSKHSATSFVPETTTKPKQAAAKPTVDLKTGKLVRVKTDVLDVTIDTLGGTVSSAKLLNYPKELHAEDNPVALFNSKLDTYYVAQSGVTTAKHRKFANFNAAKNQYVLQPGQNSLVVQLRRTTADGVKIEKDLTFKPGSYEIGVQYKISNNSASNWQGQIFHQLTRKKPAKTGSGLFHMASYTGGSISDPQHKRYEKVSFDDMQKQNLNRIITDGWVAMQQHYFVSAWVPPQKQKSNFYSRANNDFYTLGFMGPQIDLAPGRTVTKNSNLYVGPQIAKNLKAVAPGLNLTIDYGWFWFLAQPIFWLLAKIYGLIGNWGWSIILVTMIIKLVFYYPSAMSYKSMAAMRKLQPKMQALKERYGDDKQKLSQETMALYKKEKVNPAGGCLPMLIQIPFFIALYWVLLESVELRQAPFILWIHDLSAADPYFVLPILMGISMFAQQKLNPAPPDPTQAKMMMFLPVIFTFLFLHFPAGLVLYWLVNNILSFAQQWYIMRKYDDSKALAPSKA